MSEPCNGVNLVTLSGMCSAGLGGFVKHAANCATINNERLCEKDVLCSWRDNQCKPDSHLCVRRNSDGRNECRAWHSQTFTAGKEDPSEAKFFDLPSQYRWIDIDMYEQISADTPSGGKCVKGKTFDLTPDRRQIQTSRGCKAKFMVKSSAKYCIKDYECHTATSTEKCALKYGCEWVDETCRPQNDPWDGITTLSCGKEHTSFFGEDGMQQPWCAEPKTGWFRHIDLNNKFFRVNSSGGVECLKTAGADTCFTGMAHTESIPAATASGCKKCPDAAWQDQTSDCWKAAYGLALNDVINPNRGWRAVGGDCTDMRGKYQSRQRCTKDGASCATMNDIRVECANDKNCQGFSFVESNPSESWMYGANYAEKGDGEQIARGMVKDTANPNHTICYFKTRDDSAHFVAPVQSQEVFYLKDGRTYTVSRDVVRQCIQSRSTPQKILKGFRVDYSPLTKEDLLRISPLNRLADSEKPKRGDCELGWFTVDNKCTRLTGTTAACTKHSTEDRCLTPDETWDLTSTKVCTAANFAKETGWCAAVREAMASDKFRCDMLSDTVPECACDMLGDPTGKCKVRGNSMCWNPSAGETCDNPVDILYGDCDAKCGQGVRTKTKIFARSCPMQTSFETETCTTTDCRAQFKEKERGDEIRKFEKAQAPLQAIKAGLTTAAAAALSVFI